jgi:hypothetical protein
MRPAGMLGVTQRVCLVGIADSIAPAKFPALNRPAGTREALPGAENLKLNSA